METAPGPGDFLLAPDAVRLALPIFRVAESLRTNSGIFFVRGLMIGPPPAGIPPTVTRCTSPFELERRVRRRHGTVANAVVVKRPRSNRSQFHESEQN